MVGACGPGRSAIPRGYGSPPKRSRIARCSVLRSRCFTGRCSPGFGSCAAAGTPADLPGYSLTRLLSGREDLREPGPDAISTYSHRATTTPPRVQSWARDSMRTFLPRPPAYHFYASLRIQRRTECVYRFYSVSALSRPAPLAGWHAANPPDRPPRAYNAKEVGTTRNKYGIARTPRSRCSISGRPQRRVGS